MLKAQADEIELTDDDLSFEEDSVEIEFDVDLGALAAPLAAPVVAKASRGKTSAVSLLASNLLTREVPREARRGLPPPLESDVADCLASIAAEASKIPPAVAPIANSAPAPLARAKSAGSIRASTSGSISGSISRLPAIAPPPLSPSARGQSASPFQKRPAQLIDDRDEVVEQAATLPRAVRSPYLDHVNPRPSVFSRPSFAPPTPSQSIKANASAGGSVAPVALSVPREASPTVVVPAAGRSRFWLAGASAVIGATVAFAAVRFVPSAPSESPTRVTAAAQVPASQPVQAPKSARSTPPAAAPAPVAVLKFDDSDAVDITVPAPAGSNGSETTSAAPVVVPVAHPSKPRRAPRRPASTSELTLSGRPETQATPATSTPPAAPVAAAAPPPAAPLPAATTRRRLTPEQELAEAQLKASMR